MIIIMIIITGASVDKGEALGSGMSGYKDGTSSVCTFNAPRGAAMDPVSGLLIVADTHNHVIRGVSVVTGISLACVTTFGLI
jgi:lysophospholipid acyltransferase (LPLAT)-like uncharacterized protein